MATKSLSIKTYNDGSLSVDNPIMIPPEQSFYRHKDDLEMWGADWNEERSCAPCPAVYPLLPNSDHKVELTEQWQYFIRAINWNMSIGHISALFGARKAFTNRNENDIRADWLLCRDLSRPNPEQDRVRSCSRAPVSVKTIIDEFAILNMMDGTKPPPLKDGFNYPSNVNNINPGAYFYHPHTHPEMFMVATITNSYARTRPFPNGATYTWKPDGRPYVFWPYVANRPIIYSIDNLVETQEITTPYT